MLSDALKYPLRDAVHTIQSCELTAHEGYWPYATEAAAAIDAGWESARKTHPNYFNGVVYLLDGVHFGNQRLTARLMRSDFKSYLYWRRQGFPETGVRDGFGSALIQSADGAYLLGRQRAGNVNAGLAYLPGGFIDARDVANDGTVNIAQSICRELAEETGLTSDDVTMQSGYIVTDNAAHLSIAKRFVSPLPSDALKAQIERNLATDQKSELEEIVIVKSTADLHDLPTPTYVRVLLAHLFQAAALL